MARLRDILARFRPSGSPGSAATGVPADRAAELAAELGPSLAGLTRTQEEAAAIRAAAADESERLGREAAEQAAAVLADARARAPQVRAAAALPARRAAEAESAQLRAVAQRVAGEVRRRAEERMPALVERVAADALRLPDGTGRSRWAPGGSAE